MHKCLYSMSKTLFRWVFVALAFTPAVISRAQALVPASPRDRIVQPVDSSRISAVKGNVHPLARTAFDRGPADASLQLPEITMVFKPTAAQQAAVDELLASQQDRSSPNYHRWITPEQFASLAGVSENDLNKIVTWLEGQGFQIGTLSRSRTWISFSGSAQQVEAALHAPIHRYVVNGETHRANAAEPAVPAAFADVVLGFRGLNDFHPHARVRARGVAKPNFTSSISGLHFITPGDFATIYDLNALYSAGINGTGQKIAVMGQTDISMADITTFRSLAGLAAINLQTVLAGSDPGTQQSDLAEADLDLEWSGAVAPNATIYYVNSSDVFTSMIYAIDHNVAPVVSISYGNCEQNFSSSDMASIAQTARFANSQGITIVAPAGDSGAADCDDGYPATQGPAVDFPASLPYVTGIGGTEFSEGSGTYWSTTNTPNPNGGSALSYIPEIVWNDTPAPASCTANNSNCALSAGGGGVSTLNTVLPGQFPKPGWQAGPGVPADGARDVPDVSIDASPDVDGYLICSGGSCVSGWRMANSNLNVIGGTSMGVPTFAGIVALINQQAGTPQGQGNVNYILYPLAVSYPAAFHDITTGNNIVPCQAGSTGCPSSATIGYAATAGYDLASGLGSIDAFNLVTAWTSVSAPPTVSQNGSSADFQLVASPPKLTLAVNSSGSAQITLLPMNGFTGTPSFTCSVGTSLSGVTCAVTAATAPNTWTVMIQAAANAVLRAPAGTTGREGGDALTDYTAAGLAPMLLLVASALLGLLFAYRYRQKGETQQNGDLFAPASAPASSGVPQNRWKLIPGLTLACVVALGIGCGGAAKSGASGSGSTTVASAAVVVQGTANGVSHTVQIFVTVK